jgi:hypothetical protein
MFEFVKVWGIPFEDLEAPVTVDDLSFWAGKVQKKKRN